MKEYNIVTRKYNSIVLPASIGHPTLSDFSFQHFTWLFCHFRISLGFFFISAFHLAFFQHFTWLFCHFSFSLGFFVISAFHLAFLSFQLFTWLFCHFSFSL
ncbi:hypothetical protein BDF20DRAFT_548507 [Mycotypha africana]|uniref:uncharacterized protein n=1 Tax=Mycotypha africana TaxID=64632 RepID=UPI002300EC3A|nr:uncharacterized protein BDF20DRAFT_548507 [Mycotypha africana]KAI8977156.1 hypothetical protein BDF20DRAFT_548507 [Mycotypha africana]